MAVRGHIWAKGMVVTFENSDVPDIDLILADKLPGSKKQLLQTLSAQAAKICGLEMQLIFDTLLEREQLGATGIGNGIAIPHGILPQLETTTTILARLHEPVEFDAPDGQAVDIVFLLLVADDTSADHLKILSRIARFLRKPELIGKIRDAADADAIQALILQQAARNAA